MDAVIASLEALDVDTVGHLLVFVVTLLALFLAEPFIRTFNQGKDIRAQVRILRTVAVVFLVLHITDLLLIRTLPAYQHYFIRMGSTLAAAYACLIGFNIVSYFSRQKFGDEKTIDEQTIYLDSYNSRLVDLIGGVFIILLGVYWVINVWELEGLLQTTGFLGIIFAFLALTNNIWAPDIYYGLVILNSKMLEDGDVIKIAGSGDEYIINKVSFIYTTLLDVRNNHRVIFRNSQLVSSRVDNLSKRASVQGVRHSLNFKIGYPAMAAETEEERKKQFASFRKKVGEMFQTAFDTVAANSDAKINRNMAFESAIIDSGDYAITFGLYYYIDAIPNTRVTKTVRQYLIRTPQLIQEAVNEAAAMYNLQLATPVLIQQD